VKNPTWVHEIVLRQASIDLSLTVDRDIEVIRRRFEHEGMSFLTITLPTLSDVLEKGLRVGRISPEDFPAFKPASRGRSFPGLLSGLFIRVFEADGRLRCAPCVDSISYIRQISRLLKKVLIECTKSRKDKAFAKYIETDKNLIGNTHWNHRCSVVRAVSGFLWSDLESFTGRTEMFCNPGKFGSGATAERRRFNERQTLVEWPERGEQSFPLSAYASHREDDYEAFRQVAILPPLSERPVRVTQVPKTLKTPRTISIEPSYMMLRQQAVLHPLVKYLESGGYNVRFTDQTVNNGLALTASVDGALSTIDLSDASDRVSNDLVKEIFGRVCPTFLMMIQDARTPIAVLPNGTYLTLKKYASMGSGLCFPIESMVFLTLVLSGMHRSRGILPSRRSIRELTAKLAIYGDDIIVPTSDSSHVIDELEAFELKVNHEKSFTTGLFRESCGGDYWNGHNVTPVYVRRLALHGSRLTIREVAAYVSLHNQFYKKGMWHVAKQLYEYIVANTDIFIPRSRDCIGSLHFASVVFTTGVRWNRRLCSFGIRGTLVRAAVDHDKVTSINGAMRLYLNNTGIPNRVVAPLRCVQSAESKHPISLRKDGCSWSSQLADRRVVLRDRRGRFVKLAYASDVWERPLVNGVRHSYTVSRNFCDTYAASIRRESVHEARYRVRPDVSGYGRLPTEPERRVTDPLSDGTVLINFEESTRVGALKTKRLWSSVSWLLS